MTAEPRSIKQDLPDEPTTRSAEMVWRAEQILGGDPYDPDETEYGVELFFVKEEQAREFQAAAEEQGYKVTVEHVAEFSGTVEEAVELLW
jgi:uncharacterized membrane-anchored protein